MNATPAAVMDPDEFLMMPDGENYELIDGVPTEKNMGAQSDEISVVLGGLLAAYCRPRKIGRVYGGQTGYRCYPGKPKQVRKPDVSFVPAGVLPNDVSPTGEILVPPALAAEVVSPNDTYEEVEVKIGEYLQAGVKLVWVVSPQTQSVLIRRRDGSCGYVAPGGVLSGEDVVPGFECEIAGLFT